MLKNVTSNTNANGCEQQQQIDDVDILDSDCDRVSGPSAVANVNIDFPIDNAEQQTQHADDANFMDIDKRQEQQKSQNAATVDDPAKQEVGPTIVEVNENELLKEALAKANIQLMQLQTVLSQRDSMVELQQKELTLLENEKVSIKREYDVAKREKETAVVRYAMIEKTIIDLNNAKDLTARKLKDATKESEQLSNRLKLVCGERDRSLKEHRDSIRECEALKCELQMWESKNKYNQVKIKHEIATKTALETKLAELTHQFNQLNDERQQRIDSEKRSEQEQGALVILLKHAVDEKEKDIAGLQRKLTQLTSEFNEISDKYNLLVVDHEYEKIEKGRYQEKVNELERHIELNTERSDEIQQRLSEAEAQCKILTEENAEITNELKHLRETAEDFHDQREEMVQVRAKENELMAFMKDLTEKCVIVENQLILATSKASALQLENDKIKSDFEIQKQTMRDLDGQLSSVKQKRNEEAKVFGRLLTEHKNNCDRLKAELENAQGELVTQKRKHSQIVKELNRELTELRSSNQSSPRSIKSSNGSRSESDLVSSQHSPSNASANGDNFDNLAVSKEPTTKAFIARIARLQAVLAKQTEKIEFLENHCIALTNELRSKSS